MTSKPVTGYKIKGGKIDRTVTFRTGISRRVQEAKAARAVKQWEGKAKP